MATLPFSQVDVFSRGPVSGNPVAVVHDATGLEDQQLADFARWTNLSETTFLLPPTRSSADYRVRIFTPTEELPFAGHPTLGSAHAWLQARWAAGERPAEEVVQECGLGLVRVRRHDGTLAFAAPGFLREGEVEPEVLEQVVRALGVPDAEVLGASWIDNGPGWVGVELASARAVLDLEPDFAAMRGLEVGVLGRHEADEAAALGADVEVRAFCPGYAVPEDPVTGSLNAGFAVWLTRSGRLPSTYVARQGTAMGRDGRVHVHTDDGEVWVGGRCRTHLRGTLDL